MLDSIVVKKEKDFEDCLANSELIRTEELMRSNKIFPTFEYERKFPVIVSSRVKATVYLYTDCSRMNSCCCSSGSRPKNTDMKTGEIYNYWDSHSDLKAF